MGAGRPSDYDPAYCERAIEYGREGKSRAWIAATFEVTRKTLHNWEDAHPEFLHAMELSRNLAQKWWEDKGQDHLTTGNMNGALYSRSMAARFPDDWREKQLVGSDPENPLPTGLTVHFVKTNATDDPAS